MSYGYTDSLIIMELYITKNGLWKNRMFLRSFLKVVYYDNHYTV
jgi:hypothetical protein